MKKIALSLLVLALGAFVQVKAENTDISAIDNVVYMEPVSFPAGTEQTLSIKMKNTVGIQTVQFDMIFPEGVTVALDEDDMEMINLSTARTTAKKMDSFGFSKVGDNAYRVLINSTNAYTFDGNDGEIAQVVVAIDASAANSVLPVVFKEIILVDTGSHGFETERVESTITVEGVDDGRIHFDENATKLPSYTAGEKGDVTMLRTIKAGNWSTIVLPFNLTKTNATAIFGSDVEMAQFSGFEVDYGEDEENVTPLAITLSFSSYTIPARGNLSGGTPILIKTSKDISTIKVDNVTLVGAPNDVTVEDNYGTQGKFTSTFVKGQIPPYGLFLSGNKFWYAQVDQPTAAFRGWFKLDAVLGMETDFGVKFNFLLDDVETRISDVHASELNGDVYDLAGRKMQGNRLSSGIYIIGGKKVSVK